MTAKIDKTKTPKRLKDFTYLGCPLTKNQSAWCFRLCRPDSAGHGQCGRIAPHSVKSQIQLGIERHKKAKKLQTHLDKLERMYLAAPGNRSGEAGVRLSEGAAEIAVPIREQDRCPRGSVHGAVQFKLMDDAAALAVNTLIDKTLVQTRSFDVCFTRPVAGGKLTARSRLLTVTGEQYYAESVLTDAEGLEVARGVGVYVESGTLLSPDIGFA